MDILLGRDRANVLPITMRFQNEGYMILRWLSSPLSVPHTVIVPRGISRNLNVNSNALPYKPYAICRCRRVRIHHMGGVFLSSCWGPSWTGPPRFRASRRATAHLGPGPFTRRCMTARPTWCALNASSGGMAEPPDVFASDAR